MSESDIERINKTSMDRLTEKLRRRVDHMINMEASHTKTLEWEAADIITALRAKVEKLEGALKWYADESTWTPPESHDPPAAFMDRGKRARAALGDTP